ncbi:FAD binding domain-containing protein [Bacillus sp. B190/17]|uniref:FAD binding domain-containing protein n=1 Tax=Bacillus lumedeiriae TaxID=3058829 RepID=A0ABW8I6U9_9BACI
MIPFDFEYYKPASVNEAVQTFQMMSENGKQVVFYCGGTEFITFARVNKITADAVIDLKGIYECHILEVQGDQLVIGAAVSLNKIAESNLFPLLGETVKRIADHTSRNKITLGGNIHSKLMYRESILPLLLSDATVKIAGSEEERIVPLAEIFQKEINMKPGEFLIQVVIKKDYIDLPYASFKRTKMSKVGYPVVSIAALAKENRMRVAFSGVCEYPFRSPEIEDALNDSSLSTEKKIDQAVAHLPAPIVQDLHGSASYREFVLKNGLQDMIEALEGK